MTDTERSQRTTELMTRYGTDIKRFCLLQLRDASQAEDAAHCCEYMPGLPAYGVVPVHGSQSDTGGYGARYSV